MKGHQFRMFLTRFPSSVSNQCSEKWRKGHARGLEVERWQISPSIRAAPSLASQEGSHGMQPSSLSLSFALSLPTQCNSGVGSHLHYLLPSYPCNKATDRPIKKRTTTCHPPAPKGSARAKPMGGAAAPWPPGPAPHPCLAATCFHSHRR